MFVTDSESSVKKIKKDTEQFYTISSVEMPAKCSRGLTVLIVATTMTTFVVPNRFRGAKTDMGLRHGGKHFVVLCLLCY